MLAGTANSGGVFRSPIHAFMTSIQIGSAALGAALAVAERLLLVVADPHADRDVGIEADEPRVGEVVGRAGLAAERPVERRRRAPPCRAATTPRSRLVITNAVSARSASVGVGRFSSSTLPWRSMTRSDLERRHPHALVREDGEGADDFEQRRLARAERRRQVRLHLRREPEPLRRRSSTCCGPSVLHQPHGRDVARLLERAPQRDRPFELLVVVQRRVERLAGPGGIATGASCRMIDTGVKPRSIAAA